LSIVLFFVVINVMIRFDVSRTGFLYPDEFVTAFEELGSLNATQFGAIVPDQTLREVCSVLSRGGPGVLREAFIDFYRKASLFTLRKACQTTLATRSGSQTIQQSVATAQVQGAPAVPLTQSVPSQYHGQVQGATMYPAQHPGQVQGATMYPTQHPGQAQAQMYPGQHPGQPSWGQPQVQGATMYPAQHPPGQSSWGQQQVQGAPMYPTQYPGQAQAHAATMYPAQYPPGQQSWGQPQVQGSPVTQSVASAQPGQAALASPAPPPRKLSFGLKK
jgi:hypothetical protein